MLLGDKYIYDTTNIMVAFYRALKECRYIDDIMGTQYYKQKVI